MKSIHQFDFRFKQKTGRIALKGKTFLISIKLFYSAIPKQTTATIQQ
ncbi:MAG: hypothetical protein QM654_14510 [Dysgonamonadaceae bacterium]